MVAGSTCRISDEWFRYFSRNFIKIRNLRIIRFLLFLFPFSSILFSPLVYLFSFLAILYGCLTTLRQIDLKKIIAYSSVIHMNYLMFGLFSFNLQGLIGSVILMVGHGFVSGGLFLAVGVLYDRYHTRLLKYYGGLNYYMPIFSTIFLILTLGNISFPGTISFIGEFLTLLGILFVNFSFSIIIFFVMILSTCYALWLYNRLFSGFLLKLEKNKKFYNFGINYKYIKFERFVLVNFTDINFREFFIFFPLIFFIIYFGFNPFLFINLCEYYFIMMFNLNFF